jgi:hypothetical protein
MRSYLEKANLNVEPRIQIINANSKNKNDEKQMRWGFGSTLLGNAYFSFDFGETHHGQTWWYDEYDLSLGVPVSSAYRVDGPFDNYEKGLWRRDYENGIVLVNSYDKKINHDLDKEYIKKINSNQGSILIKRIELEARDSVILLNAPIKKVEAVSSVSVVKENTIEVIKEIKKKIIIEKSSDFKTSALVYRLVNNNKFRQLSGGTNIVDSNKDALYERVLGSEWGNESAVSILDDRTNRLLGIFSAYPKEFRCGVRVVIGDFDGDLNLEIATVPAWGGAHLKIFGFNGELENELFFESKDLRANYGIKSLYDNNLGRDVIFLTNF